MNPTLLSPSLSPLHAAPGDPIIKRRKLLIFRVGKLNMALPVESVHKILHYTTMHGSGTTPVGIAHLADREITVIDLYKRLFKTDAPVVSQQRQFLILASNSIDEPFAILVQTTPTLEDIPVSQIRLLPDSYRRADTLEIASHVTVVPQGENTLTAFVIDVDRLVPPIQLGDFVF